jgi:hypothetical protein
MEEIQGNGEVVAPTTLFLVDESGSELAASLMETEVELTATVNDVREGTTVVLEEGLKTGTKFIPPYITSAGYRIIANGKECSITLENRNAYDYTALQCIVCASGSNVSKSVSAEKVVINDKVYSVKSTTSEADLKKDSDTKSIRLNVINNSGKPYVIRYFTYKEEN